MIRAALPLLLTLAVALGGVLYLEQRAGTPDHGRAEAEAGTALVHPARGFAAPDRAAAWTATILRRPVFSPSRRPPEAAAERKAASFELPRLAGVLVSASGADAIFAMPGKKPILARTGDRVGPYLVRSIATGQVTVVGPSGVVVLHPTFASEAPGRTAPPVAAVTPSPVQPPKKATFAPLLPTQDFIQNVLKQQQQAITK